MPAHADPDLAMRLAKVTVELYADAAQQILQLVARRLANGIDEPGWAERKLLELAALRDDAVRVLDELQVLGRPAVRDAIEQAFDAGDLSAAGDIGGTFGQVNRSAVDALATELAAQLDSTRLQILRSVDDMYRSVIAEVAAPGVLTGSVTRRQAAQRALDRLAAGGIRGFVDTAGRRWELESYTEMAVRTAVGRAQVQGAIDRYRAAGRNLVIVTDAPQECSVCRPYEGQVLSISGEDVGVDVGGGFVVKATVEQARRDGLFHANCRHRLNAFTPGLTERMTHTADPDGDRNRQEQRRLERNVREWKRRQAAALDDRARARAGAGVRVAEDRLARHVKDHGLKRLRQRELMGRAR